MCKCVRMRACVRVCARAHAELSDSVRECVMEGSQASWLLFSWRKNTKPRTQAERFDEIRVFALEV